VIPLREMKHTSYRPVFAGVLNVSNEPAYSYRVKWPGLPQMWMASPAKEVRFYAYGEGIDVVVPEHGWAHWFSATLVAEPPLILILSPQKHCLPNSSPATG
jgi:hypothetical protein